MAEQKDSSQDVETKVADSAPSPASVASSANCFPADHIAPVANSNVNSDIISLPLPPSETTFAVSHSEGWPPTVTPSASESAPISTLPMDEDVVMTEAARTQDEVVTSDNIPVITDTSSDQTQLLPQAAVAASTREDREAFTSTATVTTTKIILKTTGTTAPVSIGTSDTDKIHDATASCTPSLVESVPPVAPQIFEARPNTTMSSGITATVRNDIITNESSLNSVGGTRSASLHVGGNTNVTPSNSMPKEAPSHGAPTRKFLNENITGVLLEGMKKIVKDRPANPLEALGEYLIQKSKEIN